MSISSKPSAILADLGEAMAAEAQRLKGLTKGGVPLSDDDFKRLRDIHAMAADLEGARSEALLILLGAKTNVKDMTPEQLKILADAVGGG